MHEILFVKQPVHDYFRLSTSVGDDELMNLSATEINYSILDDDGCAYAWFADRSQPSTQYFTMLRKMDDSENSIYFERDDQKWGGYGFAEILRFEAHTLVIQLNEIVTNSLRCDRIVNITFNLKPTEFLGLRNCLQAIYGANASAKN